MTIDISRPFFSELIESHREWLSGFDEQYARNWEKLLKADAEAAMCEAGVRRMLASFDVVVSPNEDLNGNQQRVDFSCLSNGEKFFVEVACIPVEKAEKITGIADDFQMIFMRNPTPLNGAIRRKCIGKARQSGNHPAPVLLAIGTWHGSAAMLSFMPPYPEMLLTGMTTMTVFIDKETLESSVEPRYESQLDAAAFIQRSEEDQIKVVRNSISGLLLCGLSFEPVMRVGILHPNASKPFSPSWLPDVPFCEVQINDVDGTLNVQWPKEEQE
ncbi:hypothetical protein [Bremerella alba]|uniref:Uncharacterized protein n=1 Tax=Bremerella alba TaxID=980252 RepID=A0A7V8V880_9BACT|nr:hypothetical protein [Bremerella alba]MBA2116713.1 hypothetical protein [Bremerella alba]